MMGQFDRIIENSPVSSTRMLIGLILCFLVLAGAIPSLAYMADDLGDLTGYTIISAETIEDFEGCDYEKPIVFESGNFVICQSYGYQYAYRPDAVVLARSYFYKERLVISCKMIVEDKVYDVDCGRPLRRQVTTQYLLQCRHCDQGKRSQTPLQSEHLCPKDHQDRNALVMWSEPRSRWRRLPPEKSKTNP